MKRVLKFAFLIFLVLFSATYSRPKPEIFVQLGHSGCAESLDFAPDSKVLATGDEFGEIKLWEVDTGREIRTVAGHKGTVSSIVYSPDGRLLASSGKDGFVKLWEASTMTEIRRFSGHKGPVNAVSFSPDGRLIASGGEDRVLRLWDVNTGSEVKTFTGHKNAIVSVGFSPDGKILASLDKFGNLFIWDVNKGSLIKSVPAPVSKKKTMDYSTLNSRSLAFSHDGKMLAFFTNQSGKITILGTKDFRQVKSIVVRNGRIDSFSFSPDSKYIAVGGVNFGYPALHWATIYSIATGKAVKDLLYDGGNPYIVAFSKDGKRVASVSCFLSGIKGATNNTVTVINVKDGTEVWSFLKNAIDVVAVTFSPDGRYMATVSDNQYMYYDKEIKLRIWDLKEAKLLKEYDSEGEEISSITYSPGGKFLAVAVGRKLVLIDIQEGKGFSVNAEDMQDINSIAFSKTGTWLAAGSDKGYVYLLDMRNNFRVEKSLLPARISENASVTSLRFSPDGKMLIAGYSDGTVVVWSVLTGREIHTIKGHNHRVMALDVSPDGKHIASSDWDGIVKLWSLGSGKEVWTFTEHKSSVNSVKFLPDGKHLVSGSHDGTIKVIEIASGRVVKEFVSVQNYVNSIDISPDSRFIASASASGVTKIFDIQTGNEIASFIGFMEGGWVVITPEGFFNASPEGMKHIYVRRGNSVIPADLFVDQYYKPEIVMRALTGK